MKSDTNPKKMKLSDAEISLKKIVKNTMNSKLF